MVGRSEDIHLAELSANRRNETPSSHGATAAVSAFSGQVASMGISLWASGSSFLRVADDSLRERKRDQRAQSIFMERRFTGSIPRNSTDPRSGLVGARRNTGLFSGDRARILAKPNASGTITERQSERSGAAGRLGTFSGNMEVWLIGN